MGPARFHCATLLSYMPIICIVVLKDLFSDVICSLPKASELKSDVRIYCHTCISIKRENQTRRES